MSVQGPLVLTTTSAVKGNSSPVTASRMMTAEPSAPTTGA
jgi:hypothetical protein